MKSGKFWVIRAVHLYESTMRDVFVYESRCVGDMDFTRNHDMFKAVWRGWVKMSKAMSMQNSIRNKQMNIRKKKKAVGLKIPLWLLDKTFEVQHCPNCPSPFLVRLVSPGTGGLDRKPYRSMGVKNPDLTKDTLGFGMTLAEAAENAMKNIRIKIR